MRGPSAISLLAAAVAVAPAGAAADVVVGAGVPFSAEELEAAIAARSDGGLTPELEVELDGEAGVRLVTPGGSWQVVVGDARGPSAARLVALHLVEAGPAAAPAPRPRVAAIPPPNADTEADVDAEIAPSHAAAAVVPRAWRLTIATDLGRGAEADDLASAGLGVELAAARGRWLAAAELSFHRSLGGDTGAGVPVTADLWQVRGVVGLRLGDLELVGGPLAGSLHVEGGGAASPWLVGVGGAARGRWDLGDDGWSVQVSGGLDAYRHRVVVRNAGEPIVSTPRVAILVGLGLSKELDR